MKRILFFMSLGILTIGCVNENIYKPKYEINKNDLALTLPINFKESDKLATENLERLPINSTIPAKKQPMKRRKITETMKFIGQEDPDTHIEYVDRKNN